MPVIKWTKLFDNIFKRAMYQNTKPTSLSNNTITQYAILYNTTTSLSYVLGILLSEHVSANASPASLINILWPLRWQQCIYTSFKN